MLDTSSTAVFDFPRYVRALQLEIAAIVEARANVTLLKARSIYYRGQVVGEAEVELIVQGAHTRSAADHATLYHNACFDAIARFVVVQVPTPSSVELMAGCSC